MLGISGSCKNMIGTPLAGNNDWRKVLENFSLPLSVKHDSLLLECYNILVKGGNIDVDLGTKLFESPNLSGISFIIVDVKIAGAVFFFAGSKTILYFLIRLFSKCFLISFKYFKFVLIIG